MGRKDGVWQAATMLPCLEPNALARDPRPWCLLLVRQSAVDH